MPAEGKKSITHISFILQPHFHDTENCLIIKSMKRLICLIIFTGLHIVSQAIVFQDNKPVIRGKVTDIQGSPLPGAAITIENTLSGVHTDSEGNYSLKLTGYIATKIHFSFVGYESQIIDIRIKSDTIVNVTLEVKSFMTEEVFVKATRAGENTPMAYSSVTREEISKANPVQDIPYLLSFTPSLVVSSDAGTGVGYTYINIRGTDINRINITVNGIPVNDAESHGVWWVDLPDIASSSDNIQVQRGVGTSTNGAGAFGATVNFQTTNMNREPYAELNSSYGSFNTSKNTLNFGTGLISKKFAIDGRLSKIWSDGYIDRAFSDLKSFYVSGTMYGETSILKLIIFSGVEHTYQAWLGVPKDSLNTNRTYNPYSYKNETDNYWQDNYQLHYSKKISTDLSINAALHYTRGKGYYENLVQNTEFGTFNLPDAIFNGDTITSSDFVTQRWLRNDFYGFTYSLNYRKNKLTAMLGGGWNQYLGDHIGDIVWAKIVTFEGESYQWYKGTGDKKDLNTFLKSNYPLSDKLNLYADLQFRNINYSIGGFDEDLKDVTQIHKYHFFNPKTGFIYNFNAKQKAYVSFAISQREPTRGNFTDADPGKAPGPEKLFDLEGAWEYNSSGFMLKANLYYMNYHDQLIMTGEINNVGSSIVTNVPKSYRRGIEIETGIRIFNNLHWSANFTLSRNIIPVFVDYTDNWDTSEQDKETLNNKTISFSPSIISSSVLDYNPFKDFNIIFSTKYVGKQYTDNTKSNDRMLNPYLVQNITLLYTIKNKIFKDLTCQFLINNLFNKKYETNAWVYKYIEGGSLHMMDGYFPQAGTNIMFKIGLKF
jgi:iron complex outermembrane recepter protein